MANTSRHNGLNNYLWTSLGARLQLIRSTVGPNFNWFFLPGGPGLGSESLSALTKILELPGSIWHLDLPGDGSNKTPDDEKYFSRWPAALLEAVSSLSNIILVAHSTGGMYALASPEIENRLSGLVLMDTAPDSSWQIEFMQYVKNHPTQNLDELQIQYNRKPSSSLLKRMTIASAPYSFTEKGLHKGIALLETLPFNYKTFEWSNKYFDKTYTSKWIPKNIPTLILAGENDRIISLDLFQSLNEFQRENIIIRPIKNAGHFPWIENPEQVVDVFREYCELLFQLTRG